MYCPSCSTQASDGAKFCKSCGLSLSIITQALNGDSGFSDPLRDREYKRARKQISDGIQGTSVGAALLAASLLAYIFLPIQQTVFLVPTLIFALIGLVYLFRNIGRLIDAKVGQRLAYGPVQARGTGVLQSGAGTVPFQLEKRASSKLSQPSTASSLPSSNLTRTESSPARRESTPSGPADPPRLAPTGRINREQSSPLTRDKKSDDVLARIRN